MLRDDSGGKRKGALCGAFWIFWGVICVGVRKCGLVEIGLLWKS